MTPEIITSDKVENEEEVKSKIKESYEEVSGILKSSLPSEIAEGESEEESLYETYDEVRIYSEEEMKEFAKEMNGDGLREEGTAFSDREGENYEKAILAVTPKTDKETIGHEFGHEKFRKYNPGLVEREVEAREEKKLDIELKLQHSLCSELCEKYVENITSDKKEEEKLDPIEKKRFRSSRTRLTDLRGDIKQIKEVEGDIDYFTPPDKVETLVREKKKEENNLLGRPINSLFRHYRENFSDLMEVREYGIAGRIAQKVADGEYDLSPEEIFNSENGNKIKEEFKKTEEKIENEIKGE